jgi:hypothetical protein
MAKIIRGSGRIPDYKPKQVVAWFKKMIREKLMVHPEDDILSDERFTESEAKAADKIVTRICEDVGDDVYDKVDKAWEGAETWTD